MARQLRIEYLGAGYHVIRRGNAQATIYADNTNGAQFLQTLADVVARYHWRCQAYFTAPPSCTESFATTS